MVRFGLDSGSRYYFWPRANNGFQAGRVTTLTPFKNFNPVAYSDTLRLCRFAICMCQTSRWQPGMDGQLYGEDFIRQQLSARTCLLEASRAPQGK